MSIQRLMSEGSDLVTVCDTSKQNRPHFPPFLRNVKKKSKFYIELGYLECSV